MIFRMNPLHLYYLLFNFAQKCYDMKQYISLLAFILTQMTLCAQETYEYQPFLKEGKVWNVTRWSPERETSKEVAFIVKGDTIIGDKQYKKFFEEDKYIYALREDGKKIYAVARTDKYGNPNTSEKRWYDFNVNEGDVFEMEMSYMHVKKIDYIVVNGVKRKCFYLFETDKNFPEDGHADGLWIEGIGSCWGPMRYKGWYYDDGCTRDSLFDCFENGECIYTSADQQSNSLSISSTAIPSAHTPTKIWNIKGHRMTKQPRKGVYIQDGRKIVVK